MASGGKNKKRKRRICNPRFQGKEFALLGAQVLHRCNNILENFIVEVMEKNENITKEFFDAHTFLLQSMNEDILRRIKVTYRDCKDLKDICKLLVVVKSKVAESLADKEFLLELSKCTTSYRAKASINIRESMDSVQIDILRAAVVLPDHVRDRYLDKCSDMIIKANSEYLEYVISESNDLMYSYRVKLIEDINKIFSGIAILEMRTEVSPTCDKFHMYSYYYVQDSLRQDIKDMLNARSETKDKDNSSNNKDYKYIDDYRVLNSLAEKQGFTHKRNNGDHGIFINKDCKVVVIPQGRSIGKGLSLHIQKSIAG